MEVFELKFMLYPTHVVPKQGQLPFIVKGKDHINIARHIYEMVHAWLSYIIYSLRFTIVQRWSYM